MHERLDVPLDAEIERLAVALDRLHDAVVGPRHGAQIAAEAVDGLVVERVDVEVLGADDRGQPRPGLDPHVVRRLPARLGLAVRHRAVADVRHVLVQRAAAGDVEHLAAAADAQHGEAERVRAADDGELEGVEPRLDRAQLRVRLGVVGGRVDVGAARHADPRQLVDQRRHVAVRERGQDDRHPAGVLDGPHVGHAEHDLGLSQISLGSGLASFLRRTSEVVTPISGRAPTCP